MSEATQREKGQRQMIGHEGVWTMLRRMVDQGTLPSALLFAGPPNVGKRTLAERLAGALLETSRADAHVDLLLVRVEDDATTREMVASLLRQVHTRPVHAKRRVVLLTDVDRLSPAGAALRPKARQDAPPFAMFLLTAAIAERVALTIRSRAILISVRPVATAAVAEALVERGIPLTRAKTVAILAGGRPGLALHLAADDDARERYEMWETLLTQDGAAGASVPARAELLEREEQAEEFLLFVQGRLRLAGGRAPHERLLRRSREAYAMLQQLVPARLVLEYVLHAT